MLAEIVFAFAVLISASFVAVPVPPEAAEAIKSAQWRGRLIYDLDRAAWVSTDTLMARLRPEEYPKGDTGGWVVEPKGSRLLVSYFTVTKDVATIFYVAEVQGGQVVHDRLVDRSNGAVTTVQQRMMDAVTEVRKLSRQRCTSGQPNIVVLPPVSADAPIEVYLLSAWTDEGIPLGGHHLFQIGKDGEVVSERSFSKACVNMKPPAGARSPATMTVTHLLDPTPTEIHVFMSLQSRMPLIVLTTENKRVWTVEGDDIKLVEER